MMSGKYNAGGGVFQRKKQQQDGHKPRVAAVIICVCGVFLFGAMTLAGTTMVPEVTRAPGEIVPENRAQQIESLTGGIITRVLVREGEHVSEGDILAVLALPELRARHLRARQQLDSILVRIAELDRILLALKSPEKWQSLTEERIGDEQDYASSRLSLHFARQGVAEERIRHLAEVRHALGQANGLLEQRIRQKEGAVERLGRLHKAGNVTLLRLEAEQQSLDDLRGRLIEAEVQLAQTVREIAEATATPVENRLLLMEQTLTETVQLEQERDTLVVELKAIEAEEKSLEIRAPGNGVIQATVFPAPGEVIEPGAALFELINASDRLVAEIRVNLDDIGHVAVGDTVSLKITTFDSRKFGVLEGRMESLSPAFVTNPLDGSTYFRGIVAFDTTRIGTGSNARTISVGMTATAEIVTDERSMIAYLTKPLQRSLEGAFSER